MKIVSVRDKRVKALVENPELTSVKGLTLVETRKIVEMIAVITVMTHPRDFQAFPNWRAHEWKGVKNKWGLMVTGNYRLTFVVDIPAQEVSVLDYEDPH